MRMVAGALLLLIAELAYAHAHLIGFPHSASVRTVLIPASIAAAIAGTLCFFWGVWTGFRESERS